MRCANSDRDCQWTGAVGTLDDHIASCQFALVPCPNKCEEDKGTGELLLIRKHLEEHVKTKCPKRAYECPHCEEKGTFASITEDHDQVCEKKIVACPNKDSGCSLSMEQGKTKEHVSSHCEYTEVTCVYESLGCGVRMLRKDEVIHDNEAREEHMDFSLVNVKLLSVEQKKLTATFKLSEEKYKSLEKSIALKDKQHKSLTEEHKKLSKRNETLTMKLAALSEKHDSLSMKHEMLLRKEKFIFKLSQYASKKEKNNIFFSTPFYTHPGGYKMRIKIYPNGSGYNNKGTYVSLFIELLPSQYDDQLHWPFLGSVTYELLNQLGDNNHYSRVNIFSTSHDMRVDSTKGCSKYISQFFLGHNPATNTQYLLDDALYFRVTAKLDNHKSWLVCTEPKAHLNLATV